MSVCPPRPAESVATRHSIRLSRGCGQSYFDANGNRQQTRRYLVRVWCECGWTGMDGVEDISEVWRRHNDGPDD